MSLLHLGSPASGLLDGMERWGQILKGGSCHILDFSLLYERVLLLISSRTDSLIINNLNLYITEFQKKYVKMNLHVKYLVAPPKQFLEGKKRPSASFDLQFTSYYVT